MRREIENLVAPQWSGQQSLDNANQILLVEELARPLGGDLGNDGQKALQERNQTDGLVWRSLAQRTGNATGTQDDDDRSRLDLPVPGLEQLLDQPFLHSV